MTYRIGCSSLAQRDLDSTQSLSLKSDVILWYREAGGAHTGIDVLASRRVMISATPAFMA